MSWEPRLELCTQCKWSICGVERTRKVIWWWKLHEMKVCCFHLICGPRLQESMWGVQTLAWNLQRIQVYYFSVELCLFHILVSALCASETVPFQLCIWVPSHYTEPFSAPFFSLFFFCFLFTLFMIVCCAAICAAKPRYNEVEIFSRFSSEACCLQYLHFVKHQVVL